MALTQTQISNLSSGQRFKYSVTNSNRYYKLQKLPDFDLWILIEENTNRYWVHPISTPYDAFGGFPEKFTLIENKPIEIDWNL